MIKSYYETYRSELHENVMPFWVEHSLDTQSGGYLTCLDRMGKVFDTDKFIWMQGRELWMFSHLYQNALKEESWLNMAQQGADFLEKYGRDESGNWYFSLNQKGQPLVQPYNIFSDCFVAMGFAAFYKINPKEDYADIAKTTFANILKRRHNPKGKYNKGISETRNLKNFSLPMILCNLSLEMEHLLEKETIDGLIDEVIEEVMTDFYDEKTGLILENVLANGDRSDSFEGRLIIPGHAIEAMWFIMDLAERRKDEELMLRAMEIAFRCLEFGWDKTYGGIFYFMDIEGHAPQQLEWDQKLWWVHLETLVCMSKAYWLTEDDRAWKWFEKVHEYTWQHFKDDKYPEWYGYLNRQGEVLLPLKGGKWKGCFHLPRALFEIMKTFEKGSNKVDFLAKKSMSKR